MGYYLLAISANDLTETENKLRLKSLLEKLSHIKCLYLYKCTINAETIQLLLSCCQHLRCLEFYNIYCANGLNEWQLIARILSNKIFNFSTNKFLIIVENNWITLYPIEEFVKYLISLKKLDIYSYIEDLLRNCPKLFAFCT
jgi:hypothetical protein